MGKSRWTNPFYAGSPLMSAIQTYGLVSGMMREQQEDERKQKLWEAQATQVGLQNGDPNSIEKASKLTGIEAGKEYKVLGNVDINAATDEATQKAAEQIVGPGSGYPFNAMEQAAAEAQEQQAQPQVLVRPEPVFYFDEKGMLRMVEPGEKRYTWFQGLTRR